MKSVRRERRVEQTRLEILEAAGRAFARKGLDGATMHDIARESGYTAASLYAYFPGKTAILEGLLALLQSEVFATFEQPLPADLTFSQSLELLTRRQLELADRRREAMSVLIECGKAAHNLQAAGAEAGFELYVPRLSSWLARNARPRDLGGLGPDDAATFFAGLVHAFFHRWLRDEEAGSLAARARLLVQLFLHGVTGTARRPASAGKRTR